LRKPQREPTVVEGKNKVERQADRESGAGSVGHKDRGEQE
jgi:hypothetical protein